MRILSIGNFGTGWDGSICDEEHIARALEELGHEVYRMQREDFEDPCMSGESFNEKFDFALIAQWDGFAKCRDEKFNIPSLLSGIPKEDSQDDDMIGCLKKCYGIPIVYWAFDYQADGQEWHERLVREADLYLSKRIADSKYPNWQWLSQDFAPKFLDKYPGLVEKDIDVLFTGSYLPWATERNETLKAVDEKFNLVIHSVNAWEGFKDVRPPIMDEGLPELYARAKVILSIDHTLEAGYWSDRNAQAMACGAYVLFRYISLSEARFLDNIEYFYNIPECLELIEKRLQPDGLGEGVRNLYGHSAYSYAQKYLKVGNRVHDLMKIVRSIL